MKYVVLFACAPNVPHQRCIYWYFSFYYCLLWSVLVGSFQSPQYLRARLL